MEEKDKVSEEEVDTVNEPDTEATAVVAEDTVTENELKKDEVSVLKDQLLRQAAEYDNYRKRTAREKLDAEPEIAARTVTKFLPVIDNIERAIAAETSDAEYKKGILLIYDSFKTVLADVGVTEIDADGAFDPALHQAVQQVDSDLESGTITSVFQKGYKSGDKVIRFSMVAVAK